MILVGVVVCFDYVIGEYLVICEYNMVLLMNVEVGEFGCC